MAATVGTMCADQEQKKRAGGGGGDLRARWENMRPPRWFSFRGPFGIRKMLYNQCETLVGKGFSFLRTTKDGSWTGDGGFNTKKISLGGDSGLYNSGLHSLLSIKPGVAFQTCITMA